MWVGWCDACTGFTNVIKLDDRFVRGPYYHLFKWYVFILLTKMQTETKTVPLT